MGKEELRQAIARDLYNPPEQESRGAIVCQGCGAWPESPLLEEIPKHGSDEVLEVYYCDESCKQAHIEALK